jgi:hypothetical protein
MAPRELDDGLVWDCVAHRYVYDGPLIKPEPEDMTTTEFVDWLIEHGVKVNGSYLNSETSDNN